MHRLRYVFAAAVLVGFIPGCGGEDQPNASATPEQVNADFGAKSAELMKNANTGMDPKKAKSGGAAPAPKK